MLSLSQFLSDGIKNFVQKRLVKKLNWPEEKVRQSLNNPSLVRKSGQLLSGTLTDYLFERAELIQIPTHSNNHSKQNGCKLIALTKFRSITQY